MKQELSIWFFKASGNFTRISTAGAWPAKNKKKKSYRRLFIA
jgi:hypothetical protein